MEASPTTAPPERDVEIVEMTESRSVKIVDGKEVLGPPKLPTGPRFCVYVDGCYRGACNTRERAETAAEKERQATESTEERAIRVMRSGIYTAKVGPSFEDGGDEAETTDEELMVAFLANARGGSKDAFDEMAQLVAKAEKNPGETQKAQMIEVRWEPSVASTEGVREISMWHTGGGCIAAGISLDPVDSEPRGYLMVTDGEREDGGPSYLVGVYPDPEEGEWDEDHSGEVRDDAALLAKVRDGVAFLRATS